MSARSVIGGGRKGKSPASKAKPTKSVKQYKPAPVFEKVFRSSILIDLAELAPVFDPTVWECVTKSADGGQLLPNAVFVKEVKQDIDSFIDPIPKSISKMRELLVAIYEAIINKNPIIDVAAIAAMRLPENMSAALRESADCSGTIRSLYVLKQMTNDAACEAATMNIIKRLAHVVALQIGYTKHSPLTALNVVHYCMLADLPAGIISLAKATIMHPKPSKKKKESVAAAATEEEEAEAEADEETASDEDPNA